MLENKPPVLEDAHRKIMRLEIEKEALKKEVDKGGVIKNRLKEVDNEIGNLREKTKELELKCRSVFCSPRCAAASTTVSSVILTMRRTVAEGVRICTGRATPSRMGPTVMPSPAAVLSRLKAMLAASSVGITSRFASPFNRALGKTRSRISCDSAASPCISPSTSRPGARL